MAAVPYAPNALRRLLAAASDYLLDPVHPLPEDWGGVFVGVGLVPGYHLGLPRQLRLF